MASNILNQQEYDELFGDTDNEEEFDGFEMTGDDSDIDFDGIETDSSEQESSDEDIEENNGPPRNPWKATKKRVTLENFVAQSGPTFQTPPNPRPLDFFIQLFGNDIIDVIVQESNKYARQGRKKECVVCKKAGRKTPSGRPRETRFQCEQCSVALCKDPCFMEHHS